MVTLTTLGQILKQLRILNNLTQAELSDKIEVSTYMIDGMEHDRKTSKPAIQKLCVYYKIPYDEFKSLQNRATMLNYQQTFKEVVDLYFKYNTT